MKCLHVDGDDFGLDGGLSPHIEKSDVMERTGHPCHIDFERFAERIGLRKPRIQRIVAKYVLLPPQAQILIDHSYLNDKMKRNYLRIVNERISRFVRVSE